MFEPEPRFLVSRARETVEPLLTEQEAAEVLAIRQQLLLREWRYLDGKDGGHRGPPHKKIGRAVRYRPNDLSAWVDAR